MPRQRNMAQMKEQSKTPEKELSDEEIADLFASEFKTLVIRMLTELIELSHKMKEQMKATPKRNKAKYSGNQQSQEENQDPNQQFGTKGRNKHPTRRE